MRIIALMAVFNEERFIRNALHHLADQGVETYVIDNESTDATREIVESFRGRGVCGVETLARRGVFASGVILRRKEELHLELAADWYIHYDADTIVQAPNPYRTLAEGIAAVDRAGDNAINFDEFLFIPTGPQDDHDNDRYMEEMRRYVYLEVEPLFRINAWKNIGQRIRLAAGGHRVVFRGRRVHAEPFVMRHYMVLSPAHAARKYGQRVYPRGELLQGWHDKRATLRPENISYPDPADLREVSGDNTWDRSAPLRSEPILSNAPKPLRLRRAVVRRLATPRQLLGRVASRVLGPWSAAGRGGYPPNRVALRPCADPTSALRNVLVLGCGHSGASRVAPLLRDAGYVGGFDRLGGTRANLYGDYEDAGITEINDLLLRWMLRWPLTRFLPGITPVAHGDPRGWWLAAPRRLRTRGNLPSSLVRLMDACARQQPFCYEDLRFSVTLPLWERFLPIGTRRIVVFRDPDQTVGSVLRGAREAYEPPLPISARWAYASWYRNYRRLLDSVESGGPALFVRHEDIVSGKALPRLSQFTNARIAAARVDESVIRAEAGGSLPFAARCRELYVELCDRAARDLRA